MTNCYDNGQLRAYLDGELPASKRAAIAGHMASCPRCQARLDEQRAVSARVLAVLSAGAERPDPQSALAGLAGRLNGQASKKSHIQGSIPMHTTLPGTRRRGMFAALAAVVVALSLLALPPVRAAADSLLSIFRVQQVMFVPVDADRVRQLQSLNLEGQSLFVGKPAEKTGGEPRTVASAAEAASAVGYAVSEPSALPSQPLNTEYTVLSAAQAEFTVNVATARQVLQGLGITDVEIPDALGAGPIAVDVPPFVTTHYRGAGYDLKLNQGRSPNVTLPDGVDLSTLGTAALRVLGMSPEQAAATSSNIDWNSTLVFPFPTDTDNIRQVTVGGDNGLLVGGGSRSNKHYQLYWQHGDRFYMLEGRGSASEEEMIGLLTTTAESVR